MNIALIKSIGYQRKTPVGTSTNIFQKEALEMMKNIIHWVREDDSTLGREKLPGQTATNNMAEPMMLCCLMHQLLTMDPSLASEYNELSKWCIQQVLAHIQVG